MHVLGLVILLAAAGLYVAGDATSAGSPSGRAQLRGLLMRCVAVAMCLLGVLACAADGAEEPGAPVPKASVSLVAGSSAPVHVTHMAMQRLRPRAPGALKLGPWSAMQEVHLDSGDNVFDDYTEVVCTRPGEYDLDIDILDGTGAVLATVRFHFSVVAKGTGGNEPVERARLGD